MDLFKNKFNQCILLSCLITSSYNLYATPVVEQKFVIKTTTAHLDTSIPFKITCPTCIETIKQDDHTYLLRLTPPGPFQDAGTITFTYYYGDENNACIYNVTGNVGITEEGRVMGHYFCTGYLEANIDPKSTALKVCPPQLNIRMQDTSSESGNKFLGVIFVDDVKKMKI